MKINTNLSSLIVQSGLKSSTNGLNTAIERMTTGFKINHAKDNAANYSINTKLSSKISAYQIAEDNASMGLDLVQTASLSLETMSDLTSRLRSLATQAQDGTYSDKFLEAINSEVQAIIQELNRIKNTTQYNGINFWGDKNKGDSSAVKSVAFSADSTPVALSIVNSRGFIEEISQRDTSSMTTLASVDEDTKLTSGTYSISTAEELAKLARMTNNYKIDTNCEFVLANDIDLSAYSTGEGWTPIGISNEFTATFDGNGYVISNLYINTPSIIRVGLFGWCISAEIKNVGLENVDVTGDYEVGGLMGRGCDVTISNSYVTGSVSGTGNVGGLIGYGYFSHIDNCTVFADVTGTTSVGGLVGGSNFDLELIINNSSVSGSVSGDSQVGGLVGEACDVKVTDSSISSIVKGTASSTTGAIFGRTNSDSCCTLTNVRYNSTKNSGLAPIGKNDDGTSVSDLIDEGAITPDPGLKPDNPTTPTQPYSPDSIVLQIGVNSTGSSQIAFELTSIDLSALEGFDLTDANALSTIDEVLKSINEEQTKLGAVENRLESALEQIGVAYDNLVSTQSTIRDADIAEESSAYIRNQILQQAATTLMATANQTPAIALQLL